MTKVTFCFLNSVRIAFFGPRDGTTPKTRKNISNRLYPNMIPKNSLLFQLPKRGPNARLCHPTPRFYSEKIPFPFERDDNPVRKKPKSPSYVSNNGVINTPKCLSLSLLKPAFRASNAYFHASSPDISRFSKKGRVSENAPIATKRRESPSFAYTSTFSSPGGARKLSEAGSGTHRFFTYLRV